MPTLYNPDLSTFPLTPTKAITKALETAPDVLIVPESPPTRQAAAVLLLDAALLHLSGANKAAVMNVRDRLVGKLMT